MKMMMMKQKQRGCTELFGLSGIKLMNHIMKQRGKGDRTSHEKKQAVSRTNLIFIKDYHEN